MDIAVLFLLSFMASSKAAIQGAVARKMKTSTDNLLFNTLMFAAVVIAFVVIFGLKIPSLYTFICALVFGVCSVVFQFMYANSMKTGPMSLSVFISSFNLVFPIIISAFIYSEIPSIAQYTGLVFLVLSLYMIILKKEKSDSECRLSLEWIVSIGIATLCAGGTVSSQKIHRRSAYGDELGQFIVWAYLIAAVLTFILFIYFKYVKKEEQHLKPDKKLILYASLIGVILGAYNSGVLYLNGKFPSVILNPVLNISTVLFSKAYAAVLFKEKISRNQRIGFVLGLVSIVLISI